jgi:hypothetical protein
LDAAEPPRIVFESPDTCRESDRAEELLRRTLTPALAPAHGWVVTMRVDRVGSRSLRAQGEITDATGAPVAHRSITGSTAGGDCGGLAKAVGVWAQLVLDAELRRANAAAMAKPDAAAVVGPGAGSGAGSGAHAGAGAGGRTGAGARSGAGADPGADPGGGASVGVGVGVGVGDGTGTGAGTGVVSAGDAGVETPGAWPAPAPLEKPSPEHDWYLHHEEARTLELGAGVFLMTGTGGGALAGPTAFVVVEAGHGIFLRPALAFGQSLTSLPPSDIHNSMWAATRFDACLRLPGLYTRHHGMQLDLCGGTDLGFTTVASDAQTTLPYLDLGPSIDLRGELGSRLSAVLRLVAGVNLLQPSFKDLSGNAEQVPLATGRLELAFSWDLR